MKQPPHSTNYKHGFYDCKNPYHDSVLNALNHYGMTTFDSKHQFWTLGGVEWHEFKQLSKQITFKPNSYHSIDRGQHLPFKHKAVKAYPNTEFFDMYTLWSHPSSINFDSVNIITENNSKLWMDLTGLALKAMQITDRLLVHANFMTDYANMRRKDYKQVHAIFQEWLKALSSYCDYNKYKLDIYNKSIWEPKGNSRTNMISLHYLVEK